VRKLLALGGSDNEHEAALAVRRATELLARHRLDFDALAEEAKLEHRTINTGIQTLPAHRRTICAILEACFSVRVICASLYDPHKNVSLRTIEVLGREEQVAIAEHCYHFLENRLQTLWNKNRSSFTGSGRIAKKSYYLGLLAGFRQTLERSQTTAPADLSSTPPSGLPALRVQQALENFVAFHFPRLRTMRRQGGAFHNAAYQEAIAAGRELTLHPPVRNGAEQIPSAPAITFTHDQEELNRVPEEKGRRNCSDFDKMNPVTLTPGFDVYYREALVFKEEAGG
jgi:hypothetical protein